jgi:hypothetical protein
LNLALPTSRLYVCLPLYRSLSSKFFAQWLRLGKDHVSGIGVCDGIHLSAAFTTLVQQALETDGWERLVFLEHDVLPPLEVFDRMAWLKPEHEIVGSVVFGHEQPHNVFAYIEKDGNHHSLSADTVHEWCEQPALYPVDAVGMGCTSVARHVLEDWDPTVRMFHIDDQLYGSQDMWFCDKARQQGRKVFVDTHVVCDHLTEVPIGVSHNIACGDMAGDKVEFSYDLSDDVLLL